MSKEIQSLTACVLLALSLGCQQQDMAEDERRELEIAMYYEFRKSSLKEFASLVSLIEDGDIEGARKMIRMGMFLDLHELDQLSNPTFRATLGERLMSGDLDGMEEEISEIQIEYYTHGIVEAGREFVSVPSDIKYIEECRQFLDKMESLGLPGGMESSGEQKGGVESGSENSLQLRE